ncbi:MAG TPA: hypothetical protein VFS02_22455 [Telluria sp.]|nr:hypothetical protein [Telluria sp.]
MSIKDSGLPAAGTLDGTEIVAVSQSVSMVLTSVRTTIALIVAYAKGIVGVWTKNQSVTPVALTSGTTVAIDASLSNNFKLTMTGACKLSNPTNLTEGMVLNFAIAQDATGARALTFDTMFKFPGGTTPTWVTTANAKSFISGYYDGSVLRCNGGTGYA